MRALPGLPRCGIVPVWRRPARHTLLAAVPVLFAIVDSSTRSASAGGLEFAQERTKSYVLSTYLCSIINPCTQLAHHKCIPHAQTVFEQTQWLTIESQTLWEKQGFISPRNANGICNSVKVACVGSWSNICISAMLRAIKILIYSILLQHPHNNNSLTSIFSIEGVAKVQKEAGTIKRML